MPIDNPMICDANVDLDYKDNEFNVLGRNFQDYVSVGYLRRYYPCIDPYYVRLEDLPKKVMWTTFCNPFYDFCMAIDMVKRVLIVFGVILVISSYLLFPEMVLGV